jgi:transcriptional regulator with XRE-family HTH domain
VAKKKKSSVPHNAALITGKIVKWARERIGKSQQEIADDLGSGIRAENIDDWEKEKARPDFKKVILRQAFEQDKLSRDEYEKRIQAEEERFKAQKASGGSFYRNIRIRNSRILTVSVLDAIHENRVGLRDAATLLGCKVPTLKNVASELQ